MPAGVVGGTSPARRLARLSDHLKPPDPVAPDSSSPSPRLWPEGLWGLLTPRSDMAVAVVGGPWRARRLARLSEHLQRPDPSAASSPYPAGAAAAVEQQQELLPPAPAAPDDFEGQLEFFREHGYVFRPRAIEGDVLRRAQAAFTAAAVEPRAAWEAATEGGRTESDGWQAQRYFDLPTVLEEDPVFLEVAESPQLLRLARRIVSTDTQLFQYREHPLVCHHDAV